MKTHHLLFLLVALVFLIHGCEKEPLEVDVDKEILSEMESRKIPSVAVAIIKGDEIVWERYFGNANVEYSIPATSESVYSLQSITKLVLATTVMQLWEQGLIDLQADINQYLPFEVRNPKHPDRMITPYHLLTHSSGIAWPLPPDNIPAFDYFFKLGEEPPTPIEWLPEYLLPGGEQYRVQVWKDFAPGEEWLYSNIGTIAAGAGRGRDQRHGLSGLLPTIYFRSTGNASIGLSVECV
jgi:CubicO group peptidase (beta-lactamase class C family)